jgi:hypothetical protein
LLSSSRPSGRGVPILDFLRLNLFDLPPLSPAELLRIGIDPVALSQFDASAALFI